ncbi:MAG: TfoX family protein [Phenylobacterium sp.]|uniref:TfoX/Sxy family protein n=1 Tax=Phenylobacterium sp. TaxID=1871053 RepID=UPI0012286B34|nr:TfoX/Sxy family protein [Phenylobacterium sp.]TAJ74338.1 MAG: TfoX family protein [Phenylobacterium sp.]
MATDRKTVDYLVDQMSKAGPVSARPMFGEYGVYCDGKMVAIIADGQLFLKPTPAGRALAAGAEEAPPYPGAKPHMLIDADRWEDQDALSDLVRATAAALPAPKPKVAKAQKGTR